MKNKKRQFGILYTLLAGTVLPITALLVFSDGLTPWARVGGCGTSSGSVSTDMQLKWIGRGITGSLFDVEAIFSQAMLSDTAQFKDETNSGWMRLKNSSLLMNVFFKPRFMDVKWTIPLVYKQGYGTETALLGDMTLDIGAKWGSRANFNAAIILGLPTGRYDIHVRNNPTQYVFPEMQLGSGLFSVSPRFQVTFDRDWGIINTGCSYNMGLLALLTQEYDYDTLSDQVLDKTRALKFSRDGFGGINNIGNVQPDAISPFFDFGIKTESVVHGFTIAYTIPLRRGAYDEWNKEVTRWSALDTGAAVYIPEKASAQEYAENQRDTLYAETDSMQINNIYEDPLVPGYNREGDWVVMERITKLRASFPGLSIQYSLEKSDLYVPLLFGAAFKFEYDYIQKNFRFGGFAAGLGVKFRIY